MNSVVSYSLKNTKPNPRETYRHQPRSWDSSELGASWLPHLPSLNVGSALLHAVGAGPWGIGASPRAEAMLSAGTSLPKMFTYKVESWLEGGHGAGVYWGWAPPLLPAAKAGTRILLGEVSEASSQRPDTITDWIICNSRPQSSWAEVIYRGIIPDEGFW